MNKRHPLLRLAALVLVLGVFGSGLASSCFPKSPVSMSVMEEDLLVGCMEEVLDGQDDCREDLYDCDDFGVVAQCWLKPLKKPSGIGRFCLAHCSFGWMLPLRV